MSAQATAGATTRIGSPAAARIRRGLVVVGASAAAIALWTLTGPLAGLDLTVRAGAGTQAVGLGAVGGASLLAGLAAWALLALLERTTARARRVWTVIAAVVLVLSLAGPLGSGIGTASRLVLTGLHLLVGAVLIAGLGGSARARHRS